MSDERFSNLTAPPKEKPRYTRLDFIRENPQIAALASKMVSQGNESDSDRSRRMSEARPSDYTLSMISSDVAQSVKDAGLIFQLLPEMLLVKQILTSSILSPKDLVTTELNFSNSGTEVPPEITNGLIEVIRHHFVNVYKINRVLPKILEDALFMTGSYPLAILPESSIDKVINSKSRVTVESLSDDFDRTGKLLSLGVLGSATAKPAVDYSLESFFSSDEPSKINPNDYKINLESYKSTMEKTLLSGVALSDIDVVDNFNCLKLPELKRRLVEDRIQTIVAKNAYGLESIYHDQQPGDLKIESSFYRRKPTMHEHIVRIDDTSAGTTQNIGNPLTMRLPSEACIPVHVPGNPCDHLGYFVILDETGNPLNSATSSDYYRQMGYNLYNNNTQVASQLLGSVNAGTNGVQPEMAKLKFQEAVYTYTNIIEKDLLARLRNGVYGENVQISRSSEIYRIMLSRSLVNKRTQLLFIPRELLTYFAFDYNDDGVGESLTEKSKVLSSIRSVLLFSNTMASIKNSVGKTEAQITLDPKDRNPVETVEYMMHEFARHRRSTFPFGTYNPVDLVSYLANAGIDVAVTGNAAYPETRFATESKQNAYNKPDTDLEESMRKRHIQSFGLAPETVDLSMGVDFATSVVSSNLLLSKRVLMYQEIFTEQLEDFMTKYTLNSGTLLTDLKNVITANREKLPEELKDIPAIQIVQRFMSTFTVSLPAPDSVVLVNQLDAYDKYKEFLGKALDDYFSSEFLDSSVLGEYADVIGPTKEALKAHYMRKWLAENNVLPELAEITLLSQEGEESFNLLNVMDSHINGITKSLKDYMDKIKQRIDDNKPPEDTGMDLGSDVTDTTDTTSSDTGDDFNFDEGTPDATPASDDETPPTDTTTEEPTDKANETTPEAPIE